MVFQHPGRRSVIAAACAASCAVLTLAGASVAASHRDVLLEVDGVTAPVSGFFGNVSDVLASAGVSVSSHDLVAPATQEAVKDGQTVVVRHAQRYMVDVNGKLTPTWSTARNASDLLDQIAVHGAAVAADRSEARGILAAVGETRVVRVSVDGEVRDVQARAQMDAQDVLTAAGITISPLDRLRYVSTPEGMTIVVTRVSRGLETETEALPKAVEEREDDTLTKGIRKVTTPGEDGEIVRLVYRERIDGQQTQYRVLKETRREPITEVVSVGTKEVATAASSSAGSAAVVTGNDVWAALARCESGGNPATNTGNGYYGLYQFSASTWHAMGGSGLPSEASAEEQTMRAQALQARSGWGQWPGCARRLGLL